MNEHTDTLLSGLDAATKVLGQNISQIGLPAIDQAIINLNRIRAAAMALRADNVVELPIAPRHAEPAAAQAVDGTD